jgi:DNA-binding winged helix-turn-helix (wHTH) protein
MAASADPKTTQLYKFGPFLLDPEKELLLREDESVPIAPKAFQVLLVLIRHSKQVVTKDDLMKAIWPDSFVEEANLSRNIFLLRKALGESPQDHQYIVTVPGRGYRFAEDVQLAPDRELNVVAVSHSNVEVQVEETKPWGLVIAAAVLLVVVAAGAWELFVHRAPVLTEKGTVVLADFANSTGDPVFDGTLRQGLAVQLKQSPFLSLIPDERIQQTLRLMDKPADGRLNPEIAEEICKRTGGAAVLDGSIASLGSQYVLGLKAVNCRSGEILDEEQAQAARKEEVLHALTVIASRFRTRAGESFNTIREHDTPLEQATTSSLDALQNYTAGLSIMAVFERRPRYSNGRSRSIRILPWPTTFEASRTNRPVTWSAVPKMRNELSALPITYPRPSGSISRPITTGSRVSWIKRSTPGSCLATTIRAIGVPTTS